MSTTTINRSSINSNAALNSNNRSANPDDIQVNLPEENQECDLQDKLEEYGCGLGCCIYVTYLLLVMVYICIRIYVFTAHKDWRLSL